MRRLLLPLAFLVACSTSPGQDPSGDGSLSGREVAPNHRTTLALAAARTPDLQLCGPYVNWSPFLCEAPPSTVAQYSAATGDAAHAEKLYVLRSSEAPTYLKVGDEDAAPVPVGTVLVKEAFTPVPCADAEHPGRGSEAADDFVRSRGYVPFARKGEETFRTGAALERFLMVRLDPGTPDTMDGWLFGTVTPDGEVTSAGAVANCVGCHQAAPYGGLFGYPDR